MIYIIRHGQTIWNVMERKQGHKDSPLTLKGIEQAHKIAKLLREKSIDINDYKYIVSPLYRTQQYARIISELMAWDKQPTYEPLIQEHGFGAWEGLTQEEVDQQFPGETQKRMHSRWDYVIPGGGESYAIIAERVQNFLDKYDHANNNMIIVCHEMISKVMRGILLGLSNDETLALGHPHNTIYKIDNSVLETCEIDTHEIKAA